MSGFEVAGIVLAVIPLLLYGLDAYPDSKLLKFAKSFTRAKLERREFAGRLQLLQTELRFAMLDIFKQINLILTQEQRRTLTAVDSVGAKFFAVWNEVWETKSDEIKETLEHTIEPIQKVLTHMVELLNAMVKHTHISSDAGKDTLRKIIENQRDPNFSITKNLSRRFKFATSDSKRQEMIKLLGEDIKLLKSLNKGQEQTKKFIAAGNLIEAQKSHHVFLDRVRGHCDNLYHALTNSWQCECHKSPSAMLRLEWRETPEQHKANDLRFSVILNFQHVSTDDQELWASQETEMRVHPKEQVKKRARFDIDEQKDGGDDYSRLQPVQNICQSLVSDRKKCIGYMFDEKRQFWGTYLVNRSCHVEVVQNCVSLEDILCQTSQNSKYFTKLNRRKCLSLAVNLASSLLQLHATPWLPETWCNNTIYFPHPVDVLHPYVRIRLGKSKSTLGETQTFLNPYLVALGIILLELSERKSFSEWVDGRDDIQLQSHDVVDKARAGLVWLLEDGAYENMSEDYAQVVQQCLTCCFTPVQPRRTLTEEKFREVVYRDIVRRLEMEWVTVTTPLGSNKHFIL